MHRDPGLISSTAACNRQERGKDELDKAVGILSEEGERLGVPCNSRGCCGALLSFFLCGSTWRQAPATSTESETRSGLGRVTLNTI